MREKPSNSNPSGRSRAKRSADAAPRPKPTDGTAGAKKSGVGPKRLGPPKPPLEGPVRSVNRDRVTALRKNKADALKHAKEMTARMGIKPAARNPENADGERLHVRIAHAGVCSRRAAERLILEGRVTVNGDIVAELGFKVGAGDDVRVDGQPIRVAKQYTVVLNKPAGLVTTLSDPQGRPTILRILPDYGTPLKPVGRLDMETEGLLLCTNDGELAHRLAHPKFGVEKEYQAVVVGIPEESKLDDLREGLYLEGRKTAPAKVELVHVEGKTNTTSLRITIHEGRKRQVRMMFDAIGHPVKSLKRIRYGPLRIRGMRSGEARLLGKKEVDELRRLVGLAPS